MNLIVAVDQNWGIGKNGDLLCRISADMKYFRQMTTGHTLILGRKTLESFPNKKPLPNRTHIVLTTQTDYQAEGVTLCHSIEELNDLLTQYDTHDIFVIGGGMVYEQLLPLCETAYVTKIQSTFPADTQFPNLDTHTDWICSKKGEVQQENDIKFSFDVYTRKKDTQTSNIFDTLSPALVEGLSKQNITTPTDIQQKMIPAMMTGVDIVGRSETGSGKTLSYLLPIFQMVRADVKGTQAIILTPTHELASQVHRQAELLSKNSGISVGSALMIGTAGIQRQIDKLKEKPAIVVGSTGRILELIRRKKIQAHLVKTIVLDEGDRLLADGNFNDVKAVIKTTLKERQLVLLSASIDAETLHRAKSIMKDNIQILESQLEDTAVPSQITHHYILTTHREKFVMLRKVLAGERPKKAIVFLNNPENIEVTVDKLCYHGIRATGIYGQASKIDRKTALDDFRSGKATVLVASDLGARGLDISDVTHVINVDIPEDATHYLHRAGRCGRQGANGCVISLTTPYERKFIHHYEKQWGLQFTQKDMSYGKLVDSKKTKKDLDTVKSKKQSHAKKQTMLTTHATTKKSHRKGNTIKKNTKKDCQSHKNHV